VDSVYFDTSVFLDILVGNPSTGPAILALLKELKRDRIRIYTSIVTVQEVSVLSFRKGTLAVDYHTKVAKLARIYGITRTGALTAAKYEAHILDQAKADSDESRTSHKIDCFHIATAVELRCRALYATDAKMLKRKDQFNITGIDFLRPEPKKPELNFGGPHGAQS
jgi:predicted nucleic acid-binding protein